jgi:hypothetical protein
MKEISQEEWKALTRKMLKAWAFVGLSLIMSLVSLKAIEHMRLFLAIGCCAISFSGWFGLLWFGHGILSIRGMYETHRCSARKATGCG